jgi:hypothetical protein
MNPEPAYSIGHEHAPPVLRPACRLVTPLPGFAGKNRVKNRFGRAIGRVIAEKSNT